ncbi:LssY C-terminal domain-containing protein [Brachybacterium sp. YJGR34]|uniref:LssY C-terminal domain-containing protein n=1 Tax=Brachybacterium sp. YJGR34 TaxID=2059911 RepID=UPI000E0A6331|nr:LssY C-terminal domain-containing protein [Brachybacterium sp. YJGR34]
MTPVRSSRLAPLSRPLPQEPPVYDHAGGHSPTARRIDVYAFLDNLFIAAGVVVSIWLALLYLVEGFSLTPARLLYLLVFWVLLTYITLPRLHQLMTWIYLPDYFFGRTRTTEGVLSDPINLAFDGPERDLHVAMRRAGWVLAEERTLASAWAMVRSTLLRRSYPAAPVSDLYLMGRRHDFTYQQEVGGTTTKRHHVRFWRMPPDFVLPGGYRTDWLAAGTYDRAVGFSFFTLQITHRIDENIDVERDYLVDTVRFADPQVEVEMIEEFSTAYHDRNGQGDRFRTDGDLPVIDVEGASRRSEGASAMMLPRHRPTGSSVMKSRARAATQSALAAARRPGDARATVGDELSAQWHGTVDDFHEVLARAADHHLPPPTVILTGVLVLIQAVLVGVQWFGVLSGIVFSALAPDLALILPSRDGIVLATVFATVLVLLQIGVLRRSRWARIALMALFLVDAFARLTVATSLAGDIAHPLLVGAGASALGVMAISSDASRQWVQTLRVDSREDARGTER